jgi:hypothetical protein
MVRNRIEQHILLDFNTTNFPKKLLDQNVQIDLRNFSA